MEMYESSLVHRYTLHRDYPPGIDLYTITPTPILHSTPVVLALSLVLRTL
jgi:hypothetical protein